MRERERERETDRQTDRQTDRRREGDRERNVDFLPGPQEVISVGNVRTSWPGTVT